MAKVTLGARIVLGLIYVVFGLNGFLQFIPLPPLPEPAMAFMGGLAGSGYFFPFLKVTEILGGAMLLGGCYVALSLVILAPITINIFLFHAFLASGDGGMVIPILMIILHVLLGKTHMSAYKGLLKAK